MEAEVRDLQESIGDVESRLADLYEDSSLKCVPYRLHAVLVHEGKGVSTGHYWSYIREDHPGSQDTTTSGSEAWLKYNDISVSRTTWEALCQDSEGGNGSTTASAYCLIYVNDQREGLEDDEESDAPSTSSNSTAKPFLERGDWRLKSDQLPSELQQIVAEDNVTFDREIRQWDDEHSARAKQLRLQQQNQQQQAGESTRPAIPLPDVSMTSSTVTIDNATADQQQYPSLIAKTTTTSATATTPIMATGSTTSPSNSAAARVNTSPASGSSQQGGSVTRSTPPPPTSSPCAAVRGSPAGSASSSSSTALTSQVAALVKEHANWSNKATTKAIATNTQLLLRHGPLQCLIQAANAELQRLHDLAEQVKSSHKRSSLFLLKFDPRHTHILVYLICNDAPRVEIVERFLIEQFTVPVIEDETLALQVSI